MAKAVRYQPQASCKARRARSCSAGTSEGVANLNDEPSQPISEIGPAPQSPGRCLALQARWPAGTHTASPLRTDSRAFHPKPEAGGSRKPIPTLGRSDNSDRSRVQNTHQAKLLAHRSGRVPNLIDNLQQVFFRHAKRTSPALRLARLVHVDLAAIRLLTLTQAVHVVLPLGARSRFAGGVGL